MNLDFQNCILFVREWWFLMDSFVILGQKASLRFSKIVRHWLLSLRHCKVCWFTFDIMWSQTYLYYTTPHKQSVDSRVLKQNMYKGILQLMLKNELWSCPNVIPLEGRVPSKPEAWCRCGSKGCSSSLWCGLSYPRLHPWNQEVFTHLESGAAEKEVE